MSTILTYENEQDLFHHSIFESSYMDTNQCMAFFDQHDDSFENSQQTFSPYQDSQTSDQSSDASLQSSPYSTFGELYQLEEYKSESTSEVKTMSPLQEGDWFCIGSGSDYGTSSEYANSLVGKTQARLSSTTLPSQDTAARVAPVLRNSRKSLASFSSDDDSDEDYIPAPKISSRKRCRGASLSESSKKPKIAKKPRISTTYPSNTTTRRARVSPPSRNTQASGSSPAAVLLRSLIESPSDDRRCKCPEPGCSWGRDSSKRLPDFKRHLRSHLRMSDERDSRGGHWCQGVPVEDAGLYNISPEAKPINFRDRQMIGGCMQSFSRADALKRHLDNRNVTCVAPRYR